MPISHLLLCSNLRWPFDSCFGEFEMGHSKWEIRNGKFESSFPLSDSALLLALLSTAVAVRLLGSIEGW